MNGSSQRCVNFIASLYPLYDHDHIDNMSCARSMRDGTLIMPCEDDTMVTVWWQGDSAKASLAKAGFISTTAIVDYVQFNMIGKTAEDKELLLAHLDQHFEYKTGETLYLPYRDDDLPLLKTVQRVADRVGSDLVLDALKKAFGLF